LNNIDGLGLICVVPPQNMYAPREDFHLCPHGAFTTYGFMVCTKTNSREN